MRISKNGHDITSIESWFDFAAPKKDVVHWQDGRIAKELAKAFVGAAVIAPPTRVTSLLGSSRDIPGGGRVPDDIPLYIGKAVIA